MTLSSDAEIDDELANRLSALFKELLEAERQSSAGASDARRNELRRWISRRSSALNDDDELERLFSEYIGALPDPPNRVQERRIFGEWEGNLRSELVSVARRAERTGKQAGGQAGDFHQLTG